MSDPIRIEKLADLFKVPPENREECFRQIQHAMSLAELAGVEETFSAIEWTDDGDQSVSLNEPDGTPILKLKITKAAL